MVNKYIVINILDMVDAIGEEPLSKVLSDFSCPKNEEIEEFVQNKALDFARQKISITYLVMDKQMELCAIFTLAHKSIDISVDGLSSGIVRKIRRYATYNKETQTYTLSAFLIAQLGKNYRDNSADIRGNDLMELTFTILKEVQHAVGGGIVFLECEEETKLICFYENEHNGFRRFGTRYSSKDNTKYLQLLRAF